jgi:hypothetical protein
MSVSIETVFDEFAEGVTQTLERMGQQLAEMRATITRLEEQVRNAPAGPRGEPGAPGATGPAGAPGEQGPAGPPGERGPQGERGATGERGERGADGVQGKDGAQGVPGPQGERGGPGERGERGADGIQGPQGSAGRDGAVGPQGERGERGADGIATREELEALVSELDARTLADSYQGVYKAGDSYKRGSLVTWDGSLFIALEETTSRPAESRSWQMITRKGRDGRDRK